MNTIRWNVAVSADTDQSLRMFLASQGGGRKGDLSRFIEEAVRAHILELSAEQAKAANAHLSEAELTNAVDEALDWARSADAGRVGYQHPVQRPDLATWRARCDLPCLAGGAFRGGDLADATR